MLRLFVIVLIAFNLVLVGIWMANRPAGTDLIETRAPQRPADLPTIVLMGETEPVTDPVPAPQRCYSVGPFETRSALLRARESLAPYTDVISERTTEALMELGYWVALTSITDFAEAGEAVRALRRLGMEDVSVVADEGGGYVVSLGYFLDERNARQRRDLVQELGFEASTRLHREAQPRYWLDYVQRGDRSPAPEQLAAHISPNLHRPLPCDEAQLGAVADQYQTD